MPDVTVIIPAKIRTEQEKKWLGIAIESVPKEIPIILINDHSIIKWDDVDTLLQFGKRNLLTIYHLEKRQGLAAARNEAMRHVETKFFFPLDADDYLAPNAIQIAMDKYPGHGFLYGSTILFNDTQRTTYLAREYDYSRLMQAVYFPNGCLQLKSNWEKIGGWDETLTTFEDWDYWLRSGKVGICGTAIEDVLYCYRRNPNGIIETLKRNRVMAEHGKRIIQQRHEDVYSGDYPMACCGKRGKPLTRLVEVKTPEPELHLPVEGMTLLLYIGTAGAELSFYGASGTRYRFGGKTKRGYVINSDVQKFISLRDRNNKPVFKVE